MKNKLLKNKLILTFSTLLLTITCVLIGSYSVKADDSVTYNSFNYCFTSGHSGDSVFYDNDLQEIYSGAPCVCNLLNVNYNNDININSYGGCSSKLSYGSFSNNLNVSTSSINIYFSLFTCTYSNSNYTCDFKTNQYFNSFLPNYTFTPLITLSSYLLLPEGQQKNNVTSTFEPNIIFTNSNLTSSLSKEYFYNTNFSNYGSQYYLYKYTINLSSTDLINYTLFNYVQNIDIDISYEFTTLTNNNTNYYCTMSPYYIIIIDSTADTSSNDYNVGYATGYNTGRADSHSIYYNDGYADGYSVGYDNGLQNTSSLWSFFDNIAQVPLTILTGLFNFDIFGVNILDLFLAFTTLFLCIKIFKLLM